MLNVTNLVFYTFSSVLIVAAFMVVFSRHAVQSALFLVLCFFASSVLWILLQAEFLGLALIFVYVGAVMTLFLFVVMMMSMGGSQESSRKWSASLPVVLLVCALIFGILLGVFSHSHFAVKQNIFTEIAVHHSNTQAIGHVLYTQYVLAFELAAVILLVAMIAAISVTFRGARKRKSQQISEQLKANKKDHLTLVDMEP